jgi:hypothetical protein
MNRVVVTGLGAVTPLGVGIKTSWSRLLAGHVGVASLRSRPEFRGVPSQVAGLVPRGRAADGGWDPNEWLDKGVRLPAVGGETRGLILARTSDGWRRLRSTPSRRRRRPSRTRGCRA